MQMCCRHQCFILEGSVGDDFVFLGSTEIKMSLPAVVGFLREIAEEVN